MPTEQAAPLPPDAQMAQLIFGFGVSMAISVAAKLRLADKLADGPKSVADLAAETNTHTPSLYRLLRALAGAGVFAEQADGRFSQTTLSEFLRTGVPGSQRGMADFCGAEWSWKPWGALMHSIRTGETAFDHVYGEPLFDYLAKHPDESAIFNEGMTGFTSTIAVAVSEAYDFGSFGSIVDVGGGHGILLTTILKKFTKLRGVVFDAPQVAEGAKKPIADAGLADRLTVEGGDFFAAVPKGGDAYIMKHIIHDWPDDKATTILRNCRTAVNVSGKLLLVEMVVPPRNAPDFSKILDLEMMVLPSGKERTEAEYAQLLAAAGWKLTRVVSTKSPAQVVEAIPA